MSRPPTSRARRIARLALAAVAALLLTAGAAMAALVLPQPLFPHRVDEGRLTLLSDAPLDEARCRAMLRDVDARLRRSSLDTGEGRHRVVLAAAPWRQRVAFLWSHGAGGVNYYPLTRNVFLIAADEACERLISPSGTPVPPPRTLAYFAAHEIAHSLTGERVGPMAYGRMPVWIREGIADYVALPGQGDLDALVAAYRAGARELDPRRSGLYARYRLLVTLLLEAEGWSLERLLASRMEQHEAERVLARHLGRAPQG